MIHCELKLCVGCRMCEVACSSYHFGAVSPALSRIRVAKLEEIGVEMAISCLSCIEKSCLKCPTDGLSVGEKGKILLDVELCNACEGCVKLCPIGSVGFYDGLPLFCDLCDGAISCVDICPTGALSYQENEDISLQPLLKASASPSQKRAKYVQVQSKPIRQSWKIGMRVDS